MLVWDVHEREGEPEMADVLKNLVVPQKLAQIDLDNTNRIWMNQVFTNPSKEEVTNPKIYPLTVKEFVETYNAHAKLKHFFKCNATLDKGLELQIIEDKSCICNKDGSLYQSHCNGM